MTLTAAVIGLVLVFENANLGTFAIFDDGAGDFRAFDERTTEFNLLAFADCQNFLERDRRTFLNVEFLNDNLAAFGDFVLLAAGFDNCVQPEHLHADELADYGTLSV